MPLAHSKNPHGPVCSDASLTLAARGGRLQWALMPPLWFPWLEYLRPFYATGPIAGICSRWIPLSEVQQSAPGPSSRVGPAILGGTMGLPSWAGRLLDLGFWLVSGHSRTPSSCMSSFWMGGHSWDSAMLQVGRASWRKWFPHSSDENLAGTGVSVRAKPSLSYGP